MVEEAKIEDIEIDKIRATENVRAQRDRAAITGLMRSMKEMTLLEPIKVYKTGDAGQPYVLVLGSRRLEAAKKLGWKTIPAIVEQEPLPEKDLILQNVTENLQREDVAEPELGRQVDNLIVNHGMTLSEVAVRLGKPESRLKKALDLYRHFPAEHRADVEYMSTTTNKKHGKISSTMAARVIQLDRKYRLPKEDMTELLGACKEDGFGGKHLEEAIAAMKVGVPLKQALKMARNIEIVRCNVPIIKGEIERKMQRAGIKSRATYVLKIIYGELHSQLTRPTKPEKNS